jgi:hypothetical protein
MAPSRLTLPWAGKMAPGKVVRYHGQVKWHQVRLTLPWATKTAPGKAERYHGHVKWYQARLYVTKGR